MKREIWLLSVLLFAACRTCPRLHVGDVRTMRGAPAASYRVLDLPRRNVVYAVRHESWPVDKYDTGRVSRAVFFRSTKP